MSSRVVRLALAFCLLAALGTAGLPALENSVVKMEPDGRINVRGLTFGLAVYQKSWSSSGQSDLKLADGFPKDAANTWEVQGILNPNTADAPISLTEKIELTGPDSCKASWIAAGVNGAPLVVPNALCLQVFLPADRFAGKSLQIDEEAVVLPAAVGKNSVFDKWGAHQVAFPVEGGSLTLSGDLKIHVQDDRVYHKDYFVFWLILAKDDMKVSTATLELTFKFSPSATSPSP